MIAYSYPERFPMKKLLSVLVLAFLLAPVRAEDDPQSENQAKSVRGPDGKFIKFTPQKDEQVKADDKQKDAVLDAAEVDKLKGREGKEAKVRGKVQEVFVPRSGSVAVLNLGKDHKSCFKVAIFKDNFGKFGGLDAIKKFNGKTVTIEGKVSI